MTRVNVGIDPRELPRSALLAEHREMKRIPNMLRSGRLSKKRIDKFCLGTGHMQFFTTRLHYLYRRYVAVYYTCKARGYKVQNFRSAFAGFINAKDQEDYVPKTADRKLLQARLLERGHVLTRVKCRCKSL